MIVAAAKTKQPEMADRFAAEQETLCKKWNTRLPFAAARQFGDFNRAKHQFTAAVERYRQALEAPDCNWRERFGTQLTLIDCLNAERKFREIIDFCDLIITGTDYDERPVLKGDFQLRKLEALRNLGQSDLMFTVYKQLMNTDDANPNAKLGGVIAIVVYYQQQKQFDKALAEGQIGLRLEKVHSGLQKKLKAIMKSIEEKLNK
jgi:tetratricopeptide (TPR) repeat protein